MCNKIEGRRQGAVMKVVTSMQPHFTQYTWATLSYLIHMAHIHNPKWGNTICDLIQHANLFCIYWNCFICSVCISLFFIGLTHFSLFGCWGLWAVPPACGAIKYRRCWSEQTKYCDTIGQIARVIYLCSLYILVSWVRYWVILGLIAVTIDSINY